MAFLLASPHLSEAADYPVPQQGDWVVRDFRFHTGEVLPELRLHYTTVGAPTGTPVLILHGTGNSAARLLNEEFAGELFGVGQPLDARRHFIVIPDAIGHGQSSKPSDGLRAKFPSYNYDDMVLAQYRLVTEHLGLRHLPVIIGTSMGGMHAWMWGGRYPGFMDALVPLASEPAAMAGRNWMLRRMVIDAIRQDPEWRDGNYSRQPAAWRTAQVFFNIATTGGALALYTASPSRKESDAELARRLAQVDATDTNDVLYQFDSVRDYDPSSGLTQITARVLAINTADDERNPPELGVMEQAMARLKKGRYVLLPVTARNRGHSTTYNAAFWKRHLAELLRGL
ncbi:MAG: alpha/beta fold hydrolase [Vicinamibacterales bacterium]